MSPSISYRDNFTDLNSLDAIKRAGRNGDKTALKEVARQFEAMFVQQMLKTMRATEDIFSEGNFDQSNEMKFHRDLLDQQMSLELTKGRGLGIAEVLYRQLDQNYGKLLPKNGDNPHPDNAQKSDIDNSVKAVSAADAKQSTSLKAGFIDEIFSFAEHTARRLGVAVEGVLAQAALETGWGRSIIGDQRGSSHNLFNIKADRQWVGPTIVKQVDEYHQKALRKENAAFRVYSDVASAFADFERFLSKPRYSSAHNSQSVSEYANALQNAGYATDPDYAKKIVRIANDPELQQSVARNLLKNTKATNI